MSMYLNSRYGRGQKSGSLLGVGKQASRVANYKRANNIIDNIIEEKKMVAIHSRALLIVDKSFETRFLPLLRHLIDIGYISDSINIKVIEDNVFSVEASINEYYDNGGRLIFGTQKSSTFFDLRTWFEKHPDALYFNSGSKMWITRIDYHIPDNMITTSCNHSIIVDFIFDNIICNIHKHADFLYGSSFDNIFDFVDDSLPDGQVFNQIVYVSDNTDLRLKNNFIETIQNYIQTNFSEDTQFNDKVTLQTFVLNIEKDISNNNFGFPDALDKLLSENPINGNQFASSKAKSIFIFDCFDSANCQNMLNYFSKKEYANNLIILNEKFLNLNVNDSLPFYTNFDFAYSFILAVNYSELGYKSSRHIFSDYSTPLPFIDIFSQLLDIFERVVGSKNKTPVNRLVEYLTNSFSIDRNEWHVKPLYLYGLKERYDDVLKRWNFYSSATIFKKSFNDTNTGTAGTDESWIDTAIDGYPSAAGNTTYNTNLAAYNSSNSNFLNTNLNGVSMLFSSMQEITDYTNDLDGFFKGTYKSSTYNGGANPNSTPSTFGIWKVLTNSGLYLNTSSVTPFTINITVPSQALIDGTSTNKNYWLYIYNGPITYSYTSYNQYGSVIGTYSDTVTIDIDLTYSANNYIVFFNKGNNYNGIRGPLVINFTLSANQIVNKQYRIGDVISLGSSTLGTNVNAIIDSISSDGFSFGVTRFENENSNGITSSVLKQNTGVIMSLANSSSVATMGVNPDIINVANNLFNLWSANGCYFLALLPSGLLVANDFRNGKTFWSYGFLGVNSDIGFSYPGPASLQFRVSNNNLIIEALDTTGGVRYTILNTNVTSSNFVYPLQLVVTNDKDIAIINANGLTLWSTTSRINLSLGNGNYIGNGGNYGSLYSLNGTYNLALNSNGVLNFTNINSSSTYNAGSISQCSGWSNVYNLFKNNTASYAWNNYKWIWNTPNSYSNAPPGTVNFYTTYTNTRSSDINATLWCSIDDSLDVYMNGNKLPNYITSWNTIISNTITLKAGTTTSFKFVATNGGGAPNPAGLIFWCLENGNTNDATNTLFFSNNITTTTDTTYNAGSISQCSGWSNVYNLFKNNTASYAWNNYNWIWNTANSYSSAPVGTVNFYTSYTNTRSTDITATLWCSVDDTLDIYMNGNKLPNYITSWNTIISNTITLKAGVTSFFKFVATNGGGAPNPAGLIFWCLENGNTNDATNTLFFSSNTNTNTNTIYSITNPAATSLKFSYTTNLSTNVSTFALGLYNSSNGQIYDIIKDGSYISSTTFDIENNRLVELPFVAPYACKLSNNGDLIIVDANNNNCWTLGKADKTSVTQDLYDSAGNLTKSAITGISAVHPRQGDYATIHNPVNTQYSNATATIAIVNSDKSIKAVFYDEDDSTIRSKIINVKPALRYLLVTDSGITRGQNFMPVSNTELFNLVSDNKYYSASIGEDCIVRVKDNRNGRINWSSYPPEIPSGQTIQKCNGLKLDNDSGSLYVDVISENIGNSTSSSQNVKLYSNVNYTLAFYASGSIPITVNITSLNNALQPIITLIFTPTNSGLQLFTKVFSVVTNDTFNVTFSSNNNNTIIQNISITNEEKYYIFQNSNISSNASSYSLNMQDDCNLCVYQYNKDGSSLGLWCTMAWQTESWTSNSGVIQAFEYWNQYVPPRLISTNGNYYLSMDFGNLGIMSYKNGGYNWVDQCFRYIGMPLFYSNATGMAQATVETSSSTKYYSVYNNGSVNTNANNSATGGYWGNICWSGIMNTFSPGVGPVVANNVQVVWTNSTATTGTGNNNGQNLNFYYTYNNPTGKWIWSQLWVSVLESCNVYINNTYFWTVGGSTSASWNNLSKFDFNLPPGNTTFKFVAYNSSGRAGLAFLCIPKYISSCDLSISGNNGNLMVQNVTILTEDNYTVTVPGVSNLTPYPITNFTNTGSGPYRLSFEDNGVGGSDGTLSIINNVNQTIFSSNSGDNLAATLPVPDDRNGILKAGVKLYAQQDENELESFLWSPSAYSFFGIAVDTSTNTQTVCIFDARFTKPVYTFYTSTYTTLTSFDAISYLVLTTSGAIVAYNILGSVLHNITANISGYTNYSLVLNDSNILSILGNNNSINLATYNQTWGTYENTLLSYWNGASYWSAGNTDFASLLKTKSPWGIYAAESYSNNVLYELRGNGRNATCSGVTLTNGIGYGATADIPYIYGTTTSKVTWPNGSIPTNFTVCSITRYTGGIRQRILTATSGNWLHGHWAGEAGTCYYEGWIQNSAYGPLDNWVVMCGKNNGTAPNNVLVDGSATGKANGGTGGQTAMTINNSISAPEPSDWAFSHVFIWDQNLSDADMRIVCNGLIQYLADGISINNLINGVSERGERLLTSSNGNYTLTLDNGSLNINAVTDTSTSSKKDINTTTLYSQLYNYTGTSPEGVHVRLMPNGTYIVCQWPTSYLMWGDWFYAYPGIPPQTYSRLPDGNWVYMYYDGTYTKMVTDTGEARYYTGPISWFNPNSWSTYSLAYDSPSQKWHYNLNIVPLYTFGTINSGIPGYKLVLGNTGELVIHDCSIPRAAAIDSGSISQCPGWSNVYNMFNFASLLKSKPPWGIYAAESYSNNTLYELRGNGRNATCSGVTLTNGSGSGATANIPYIYGSTTSKITWPNGSIPTNFTICSITRYTGGTRQRILTSTSGNWLHGHWSSNSGVCYYGNNLGWFTNYIAGYSDNWVITCGKNNGTAPNNILVNGTAKSTNNGGAGVQTAMSINICGDWPGEVSDWAFSHVFIWDQTLTDDELRIVSNGLSQYLNNGISINNFTSYGLNNYRWLWNTANSYSSAPPSTTSSTPPQVVPVNFYTTYTNTRSNDINATLWCSIDDTLDVYMNGIKLSNSAPSWNTIISNTITLTAGTTSLFKFVATNGGGGPNPAGLIFWCIENGNTNDATNTLFFSNTNTVYCSDGIYMGASDFGIQTWSSGTAYSETIPYPNYSINTSDIPENQLISIEYNFKIPSIDSDTEEYTKIYSQNRLYYLRLEIDGTIAIYLSNSSKRIWSNGRPYSGANNAARIGFVYGSDGNGTFGLWDSKGLSYGYQTIPVIKGIVYTFYLGNDRILRLVGSNGTSVIFNP